MVLIVRICFPALQVGVELATCNGLGPSSWPLWEIRFNPTKQEQEQEQEEEPLSIVPSTPQSQGGWQRQPLPYLPHPRDPNRTDKQASTINK